MFSKIKNKQINTVFTVVLLFFLLFTIYRLIILITNAFTQGSGSNAIFSLINFKNVEVTEIDTNNHNPLLETDEIVLKIKEMTETKQRN